MPFPSALTAAQYNTLRGNPNPSYNAAQYMILNPNTIVFRALVNGTPSGTSFAQVSWDNASIGAYTDVLLNQTVYISSTTDLRSAEFVGRVRLAPTSNILYINETSVPIQDNWYITVIRDWRVFDRLARQVTTTQYKDYNITYRLPSPYINGLQSAYVGVCGAGQTTVSFDFTPSATPIASGASISAWLWTIPSGVSITSGSTTTQDITVSVDAGTNDWIQVRATDSNGQAGYFRFRVCSVPNDFTSVITPAFTGASLAADENGWNGTVTAFDGVDAILDNTQCIIFDVERYNGVEENIVTNIRFVGRFRKETDNTTSDPVYSQLKQVTYELEGALGQFSRIEHLPFTLLSKVSPTKFDELKDLSVWRSIAYTLYWHTTFLELYALSFDSTDDTFLYLALPTQGGNILNVVQDLAVSINGVLESAASGECQVVRNAIYLTGAQRSALTTVADFDERDIISIDSLELELVETTGKVQASGGFFNSTSKQVTPLLSLAPGIAQGIGADTSNFTRQILASNVPAATAQSELNARAGHEYERQRRGATLLSLTLPDGYHWITPSVHQWYTWAIAADDTTGGRVYTASDRWQCINVSVDHDNISGAKNVQATFQLETSGTPGQYVPYPVPGNTPPAIVVTPPLPPFTNFPTLPTLILPTIPTEDDIPPIVNILSDGNTAIRWDASSVWLTTNLFTAPTPNWTDITPVDGMAYTSVQWARLGSKGIYVLANDGTDSYVYYSADASSPNLTYTTSDTISGIYNVLRTTGTAGEVYAYAAGSGSWSETFDFTVDDGGWSARPVFSGTPGTYAPGAGWDDGDFRSSSGSAFYRGVEIEKTFSSAAITGISFTFNLTIGAYVAGSYGVVRIESPSPTIRAQISRNSAVSGSGQSLGFSGSLPGSTTITLFLHSSVQSSASYSGAALITSCTVDGVGANPFGGSGNSTSVHSTDFAATFGTARTVGTAAGAFGGFDTVKAVGSTVLAGANLQTKGATSGGVFSNYGMAMPASAQPQALWIPRYAFGSTSVSNTSGTLDFLVSSGTLSANAALWKNENGTMTDITPLQGGVGGVAVSAGHVAMPWKSGSRIAGVFSYPTGMRLKVSTTTGSSWTDRGALSDDALYIRYRNSDTTMNQLYIANGTNILVSADHGATLLTRIAPNGSITRGIEVY